MATATTLIGNAYVLVGTLAPGETLETALATDALARLNNMVSLWRTNYLTVLAIERQIFPLVADKQTYTIGLGGDFNVNRPMAVDAAALWLNGLDAAVSVSSITRSVYAATVTQTAHGLSIGDEVLIQGAAQLDYNGLQTVQTVPSANTYTFTVYGTPITPATGTITAAAVQGQPIEQPYPVLTTQMYQAIQIKNLPNSQFTGVYYNTTIPFGTIVLWPKPDTAQNQLVLYLQNVFAGFAAAGTDYAWPDTPGYAEALTYNLAVRLWTVSHGSVPVPQDIRQIALESFASIKRANLKIVDLPNEAAWAINTSRRWGYDINSNTGG